MRSSKLPPFIEITRLVKPGPAEDVEVTHAPTKRSLAFVVPTDPLSQVAPLPCPLAVTSKGLIGSRPVYSAMRTSGFVMNPVKVTETMLPFGRDGRMSFP